ncbi:hypothetical protein L2E82_18492 [Cichorium intybus]|uniref:Uncharacterized protein n=1 Tax=Cichorium intybus TaxID=13427 RepID=A0ACB9FA97_CICIN|nr:hypothetical protein L2E82_18492 [Cichorium intybus]
MHDEVNFLTPLFTRLVHSMSLMLIPIHGHWSHGRPHHHHFFSLNQSLKKSETIISLNPITTLPFPLETLSLTKKI